MTATAVRRVKTTGFAVFCSLLASGVAAAQTAPQNPNPESREGLPASYTGPVSAVAAVVDDQVVTTFDVQQRMQLMVMSSGNQVTREQIAQVQQQALRDLIEEQLKLAEAKKFELVAEDAEIQSELAQMAGSSGLTVDQLKQTLEADGLSFDSLVRQVEASIVWPQIVSGRYRSRVRVSDTEIEQTLARMRQEAGEEQYLVSEICIPVGEPARAQEYYQGSLQLIEQMRRGVPFAVVAQQFSACTSAAGGGDLGWIRAGELPKELDAVMRTLQPGSVSNPISSEGAFMILAVRDKREPAAKGEETFTLVYAGAPLSMGRNDALLALEKLKTADVCGRSGTRQDLGPDVGLALIENVRLSSVDERFRGSLEDLARGELSAPIEADGAIHEIYVCEKDDGLGLPSRGQIEDRIFGRQLNRISQQYLRDLEREVHVDIRLRPETSTPSSG